jgi:hypothetical protein
MRSALAITVLLGLAATSRADSINEHSGPAGEVNVLWPLIGISVFKVLVPTTHRGELVTGVYADYAQVVRPDAGKVALIAGVIGYRQFIAAGFHVELTAIAGVRHEQDHMPDGATLNDGYIRAFPTLGYQHALSPRFYINARGGVGVIVYRETHYSEERKLVPNIDINLGVRL